VLLIEEHQQLKGSSSLGYGGISYWAATTALTRQLSNEGIARQRELSQELGIDTEFREMDLLLTIEPKADPSAILAQYDNCAIAPKLLNVQEACDREPLLNPEGIGGALFLPHAHINLDSFVTAHSQAFQKLGGEIIYTKVENLLIKGDRVTGVATKQGELYSDRVVVCAGGLSRALLKKSGINARIYFTHAEAIETESVDFKLRSMVMPANSTRDELESATTKADQDVLWDIAGQEILPPSIDAGAIQFLNGRIRFGQLSRLLTDAYAAIAPSQSEADIRASVGKILPKIAELKGVWRNCLVAFSCDNLPLVGSLDGYENLHLFSGFTSPTVYVPTLSKRFAAYARGQSDTIIPLLSPQRFV
jgi:glycine/D-amino acid oxidase-like deaminating enzyme